MRAAVVAGLLVASMSGCAQAQADAGGLVTLFRDVCISASGDRDHVARLAEVGGWATLPFRGGAGSPDWGIGYQTADGSRVMLTERTSRTAIPNTPLPDGTIGTSYASAQSNCAVSGSVGADPEVEVKKIAAQLHLEPVELGRDPSLSADVDVKHWGAFGQRLISYRYQPSSGQLELETTVFPQ